MEDKIKKVEDFINGMIEEIDNKDQSYRFGIERIDNYNDGFVDGELYTVYELGRILGMDLGIPKSIDEID